MKPSNAMLAMRVQEFARNLYMDCRDQGLSLAEQSEIFDAAYRSFNSATAAYQKKQRDAFLEIAP